MAVLRQLISKTVFLLAGISMFAAWASAICIHLFTIITAYQVSGFVSAVIVFLMPVVAELYWLFKMWHISSPLLPFYFIGLLCAPVFSLLCFTLGYTASRIDPAAS